MYSILIQNQKTMESFYQFHPLYMDALNDGLIDVCQWFEAGETIETAVPELYSLTEDKEDWRAIIVRIEDESAMEEFPAQQNNPYDFVVNADSDGGVKESPVPLVRLTQMLGGVPAPQLRFECKTIKEPNKAPRVVYQPTENAEEQKRYEELSEKYHFNGRPPSEIFLISLTYERNTRVRNVEKAWQVKRESESSEFWRRNGYPSNCRFMFFEMHRQGMVQKTADLFKVWTSVMLLSTNEIDPSTLQAYRLHRLDVDFDTQKMCETMQNTGGRILGAKQYISKSIQRELEQKINRQALLPSYRIDAPVVLNLPPHKDIFANDSVFHLTAATEYSDMKRWNEIYDSAESGIAAAVTCAERALDLTADRMRLYCFYSSEEIVPLDRYQREDMDTELDALHSKVFELRGELLGEDMPARRELESCAKRVRSSLAKRMTKRQAIGGFCAMAALFLLFMLPAFVFKLRANWGSWPILLLCLFGGVLAFSAAETVALLIQRHELHQEVHRFNSLIHTIITHIAENGALFSRYMSNIASHIHGSTYLSLLKRKTFLRDEAQFYKQNHLAALDRFLADVEEWSVAFHLPVNFETADIGEELTVDTDVAPGLNPLYTFDGAGSYSVMVNSTGDTIEAPFGFIQKLHITREELYDDAG